jgi:hypothetical protein
VAELFFMHGRLCRQICPMCRNYFGVTIAKPNAADTTHTRALRVLRLRDRLGANQFVIILRTVKFFSVYLLTHRQKIRILLGTVLLPKSLTSRQGVSISS